MYLPLICSHLYPGFVFVDDLFKLRQFQKYSEDDIKKVVAENDKKRFALRNDPPTGRLQIRANQGHTMEVQYILPKFLSNASLRYNTELMAQLQKFTMDKLNKLIRLVMFKSISLMISAESSN